MTKKPWQRLRQQIINDKQLLSMRAYSVWMIDYYSNIIFFFFEKKHREKEKQRWAKLLRALMYITTKTHKMLTNNNNL